jgi:hypothetical protein
MCHTSAAQSPDAINYTLKYSSMTVRIQTQGGCVHTIHHGRAKCNWESGTQDISSQEIQNKAAQLITLTSRKTHMKPILKTLHWLSIAARIKFKILLLVYKALSGLGPVYLCDLLKEHQPARQLRSSSQSLLKVPRANLITAGDKAFSVFAPKAWNSLPLHIRQSDTVEQFKRNLKTHFFKVLP